MDNTKRLGLIGELKAQYDFVKAGFDIAVPLGDYCPYDLIINRQGKEYRIQVKSCEKIINGRINFNISSRNYYVDKIYTIDDADYFYLYCLENEQSYLYAVKDSNKGGGFYLRIEPPKNNQVKGINFAKDFEFNKVVNQL